MVARAILQVGVESNTGSSTASTAREGIMAQDRPGKHEKKSKEVAVAEKCGQSNGAEECVWLRKRQRGCMLHDCCTAHWMELSAILQAFGGLAHRAVDLQRAYCKNPFVLAGGDFQETFRGKEGSKEIALHAYKYLLIPQQFCRLNCGFKSDRPGFACFFQKTDVIGNSYRREGFCTDSQHCGIRTKLFRIGSRRLKRSEN